jgi:hypothetical protein
VDAVTACRSCEASIVWCWTTKGVRIPIDPEPVPDGNVTVDAGGELIDGARVLVGAEPGLFDPPNLLHYRTHFVTCPDRDDWRNRPSHGGG